MGKFFDDKESDPSLLEDELNDYLKMVHIRMKLLLIGGVLLMAAVIFAACLIKIPVTRNAKGMIYPEGGASGIYSNKEVHKIVAHAGEVLKKGEIILEYGDGSKEEMPADGMVTGIKKDSTNGDEQQKLISYVESQESKLIYVFVPVKLSVVIKEGQKVKISPSITEAGDRSVSSDGVVQSVSDSFFEYEDVTDFMGAPDYTEALLQNDAASQTLYRLVGISSEAYTGSMMNAGQPAYANYAASLCDVRILVREVSVLEYLMHY